MNIYIIIFMFDVVGPFPFQRIKVCIKYSWFRWKENIRISRILSLFSLFTVYTILFLLFIPIVILKLKEDV